MSDYCMCHILSYWEELNAMAEEALERGAISEAEALYREALYRAKVLVFHKDKCGKLDIAIEELYTISHKHLQACHTNNICRKNN